MSHDQPGAPAAAGEPIQDSYTQEELDAALREVPKGALALAGLTVGLLVLAWLAIYVFVFLPRGMVG
jgi:hypothetical protein